jgi:tetratricopeptide (TPR) repeat protein
MHRIVSLALAAVATSAALGSAEPNRSASAANAARPRPEDAAPTPPKPAGLGAFDPSQVAPPVARLDSAEIYYAWGDFASVVRVLGRSNVLRPRGHLLLGWSLYRLGRMVDSEAAFARGLGIAPENLDLINGHAFALYRTERTQEAETEFRRILSTNPDREESIRGLAVVLYTSQRFEEGLPIFDKLLRDHPGDPEAEHHLVKSVDGMLTAWRQSGRTPAEMVSAGWKLAEGGNRRSALEIFRWVLTIDPFHPGARLGLGTLGPPFGRETEARHALEELLRENPDDTKARAALAQLHLDAGRSREAREQVDALLAASPQDARALALKRALQEKSGGKVQ